MGSASYICWAHSFFLREEGPKTDDDKKQTKIRLDDETARRLCYIKSKSFTSSTSAIINDMINESYENMLRKQTNAELKKQCLDSLRDIQNMIEQDEESHKVKAAVKALYMII